VPSSTIMRQCCVRPVAAVHSGVRASCSSASGSSTFRLPLVATGRHAVRVSRRGACSVCAAASQLDSKAPKDEANSPEACVEAQPSANILFGTPLASISRVLVSASPQNILRSLTQRKAGKIAGPVGLLLLVLGFSLGIVAAVRSALVKRAKACKCCSGYGIVRCNLCNGTGKVGWRAKFSYSEMCPLCMAKRFVECPDCGGYHHKPIFVHETIRTPSDPSFGPAV